MMDDEPQPQEPSKREYTIGDIIAILGELCDKLEETLEVDYEAVEEWFNLFDETSDNNLSEDESMELRTTIPEVQERIQRLVRILDRLPDEYKIDQL